MLAESRPPRPEPPLERTGKRPVSTGHRERLALVLSAILWCLGGLPLRGLEAQVSATAQSVCTQASTPSLAACLSGGLPAEAGRVLIPASGDAPVAPGAAPLEPEAIPAPRAAPAVPPAAPGWSPPDETPCSPEPSVEKELARRDLLIPVLGVVRDDLRDSFFDRRSGRRIHHALDIMSPRNTPILAVEDGTLVKLTRNRLGGLTLYQLDPSGAYAYYYAHLERYAPGLHEGDAVERGQVIGYVGTSGNAPKRSPHLHFAIFRLPEERYGWLGQPIDPFDVLRPSRCLEASARLAASGASAGSGGAVAGNP